jgi:peptidoglycan-associated lipoprotein
MKLKHIYFLIATIGVSTIFYSCGAQKPSVAAAEKAFNNEKYFMAADLYKKAIPDVRKKEAKAEITFKIGECYRLINNNKQAGTWYEKAIKAGYEEDTVYVQYANALKAQDRFDDAIDVYKEHLTKKPNDSVIIGKIENCKKIIEWKKKDVNFEVYNEASLNTKDMEYAPSFYGKGIIFTSNRGTVKGKNYYERTGKNYENIYASQTTGKNKWTKAEPLNKDINTPFNEGVASFDNNNRILYFTQCNGPKGKESSCRIYETQNEGNTWSAPKEVMIPNPDSAILGHPSITADGNRIYFVSDFAGGIGGKDIWYSDKQGTSWSTPVNAGPKVNTTGDEEFPFIHPSGTLYFSSTGHSGMGGFDIFFCDFEEGDWTEAMNLKSPTNSAGDDFGFILDESKEVGYLSSNRFGGKGEDDIYSAYAIPLVFTVSGKTINNATSKVLAQAKVTIIGSDGSTQTITSDATGSYKFTIKKDVNYQMNSSKYRFFGDVGELSTYGLKESKEYSINFKLNPIPLKEIVLKGILYDLAKADLREESIATLDSLIKTLRDNPTFVVEVAAHTDSRADSTYNNDLSQRRAQSVVNYLVSKEIERERLVPRGYGESRLLNDCKDGVECTEEQHQENRRTSFSVISEDYVSKEAPKIPEAGKPKPAAPAPAKPGITPRTGSTANPGAATGVAAGTTVPANSTPAGTVKPATPNTTGLPASATPSGTTTTTPGTRVITRPAGTTPANNNGLPASATPSGTTPTGAKPGGVVRPSGNNGLPASATPSGTTPASTTQGTRVITRPAGTTPAGTTTATPGTTKPASTPAGTTTTPVTKPAVTPAGTTTTPVTKPAVTPATTTPATTTPATTAPAKPKKP